MEAPTNSHSRCHPGFPSIASPLIVDLFEVFEIGAILQSERKLWIDPQRFVVVRKRPVVVVLVEVGVASVEVT